MKHYLVHLDRQITEALAAGRKFSSPKDFRAVSKIIFCGMGGSAISGDILRILALDQSRVPMLVSRGSKLPASADRDTLVILSSYSGNTHEILEVLRETLAVRAKILIVTSGGTT